MDWLSTSGLKRGHLKSPRSKSSDVNTRYTETKKIKQDHCQDRGVREQERRTAGYNSLIQEMGRGRLFGEQDGGKYRREENKIT